MRKAYKTFKQMTPQEKRHSVYLWTKYYESQLNDDFIASWKYWNERMDFLVEIGIQEPIAKTPVR